MMKYLISGVIIIAIAMFYFMSQSNKASAERLKQAEVAHLQKLEQEKAAEIAANKNAQLQKAQNDKAKLLQAEKSKLESEKNAQDFKKAEADKEVQHIKFIEDKVRKNLVDPESAMFKNIKGNCGEFNAKNKMGGYGGYRRFIYNPTYDTVSVEDEKDGLYNPKMMDILWGEKCP